MSVRATKRRGEALRGPSEAPPDPAPSKARARVPGRGLLVAVYGADGSGKSSVIEALIQRHEPGRIARAHFRPGLGRPGLGSGAREPVTDPHGRPPRGPAASVLKLAYYLVDFRIGYFLRVRPQLARGTTVLFDRYYHDLLVDPRRFRYGGPSRLARLVGTLVPRPDLTILLDGEPALLLDRKREVEPQELERLTRAYRELVSAQPRGRVVSAAQPFRRVVEEVEGALRSRLRPGERERYKRFPPGLGHIHVPVSSRPAATAALATYAPCRPLPTRLHKAARLAVQCLGPRVLPGKPRAWSPPMAGVNWDELRDRWLRELGPFDSMGVLERPQASRPGHMLLLLQEGRPVAFVKVRRDGARALGRELRALRAVAALGPRFFSAPEVLASGCVRGWDYSATSPLPPRPHRVPRDPPFRSILSEVTSALETIPRPEAALSHWRPMHGDFTPWNLRQLSSGELVLYDWEDAGWGPPGADEVLYRAAMAAISGRSRRRALGLITNRGARSRAPAPREAIAFWQKRIDLRLHSRGLAGSRDRRLTRALRSALDRMEREGE